MAKGTQRKKIFAGRDRSWMLFNRRVLEEAEDQSNPLLERVKFLSITGSNLDEYVEIRLAGLLQRTEDGHTEPGYDGLLPEESLDVLTSHVPSPCMPVAPHYAPRSSIRAEGGFKVPPNTMLDLPLYPIGSQ